MIKCIIIITIIIIIIIIINIIIIIIIIIVRVYMCYCYSNFNKMINVCQVNLFINDDIENTLDILCLK